MQFAGWLGIYNNYFFAVVIGVTRVMRFRKITETENRHKITEITDSFNQ